MAINFPTNPTLDEVYTEGDRSWKWNGSAWDLNTSLLPLGPTGPTGPAGPGLPTGGGTGDYIVKNSATDYDASWTDRAHASILKGYAKNMSGGSLAKGTPVYLVGIAGSGFTLEVAAADAGDPAKMPAIGVLNETLANEAEGELIILGEIQGVNTSAFTGGDKIYVADGGGYTNVAPTGADVEVQFLGVVTKIDNSNGGGYITGTGIADVFRYNSSASSFQGWDGSGWVNVSTLTTGKAIAMAIVFGG